MSDAKYSALFDTLKREILSGKYPSNKSFPSVRGLIRRFGLSDRTVRHALDELFAQGLISREQGRGGLRDAFRTHRQAVGSRAGNLPARALSHSRIREMRCIFTNETATD